ncbi:hypothetical protein EP331_10925 [bacterium]|nr:MAG: hypothetical protein EP331_10925 [bacterium]
MNQADYDKIKNEYKDHFKKMKELKDRLAQAKHTQRITKAIQDMDAKPVMESMDEMMDVLREKVSMAEAKLSIALDSVFESEAEKAEQELSEEQRAAYEAELKKQQAKDAVAKMKAEMGTINAESKKSEVEDLQVAKTLGPNAQQETSQAEKKSDVKKTIGPKG